MPIRSAAKEFLLSGPLLKRGLCEGGGLVSISLYLVIFVEFTLPKNSLQDKYTLVNVEECNEKPLICKKKVESLIEEKSIFCSSLETLKKWQE